MGRHVAGESFLKGYLSHGKRKNFSLQVENVEHLRIFRDLADKCEKQFNPRLITRRSIRDISDCGVAFYPGPNLASWAKIRSNYGDSAWSICGVTHTISSENAMDSIVDLVVAPLQPWDALICTSMAVKRSVEILLERQIAYMSHRFAVRQCPLPQLPIIPLGVHQNQFQFEHAQRLISRKNFLIKDDEIVVLYVGRLSFHAKASPFPMYKALEEAARRSAQRVVLLECGWFKTDFIERSFVQAGEILSPSLRILRVDGREFRAQNQAWACADIFCSFSDNIKPRLASPLMRQWLQAVQ